MTPEAQQIAIAEACGYGQRSHDFRPIPNYPSDLNACHEMEKVLTPLQLRCYALDLRMIQHSDQREWTTYDVANLLHATAAQRAEAFLRCLELWKE